MVTEYAYPILGGISEHVHFLSRELAVLGHEVTVVTGRSADRRELDRVDERAERDHGYRTVRVGRALPITCNGSIARVTPVLARTLRRALEGVDVVHGHGLVGAFLAGRSMEVSDAPCRVGTFHTYTEDGDYWAYRWFNRRIRRMLDRLHRRIAVSDACVDGLEPYFGGGFDVIPNGVDCDRFRPLAANESRPDGMPRILFVARLEPRNALPDLLNAVAILRGRGIDAIVQVAGDGPTRAADAALADRLGIADRVDWLGLIHDDLPRRYREATVMAAPCTLASFGVILIEAAASGTPVVCADNVGFRQVIRDDMPGRFVPMRDPAALADGLAEVLERPALRAEWGRRGRELTEQRYSWPRVAQRIADVYADVLAHRTPHRVETKSSSTEGIFRQ